MTLKITSDNIASTTLSTLGGAKITSLAYSGVTIGADAIGGETLTITGSGFSAGATVYVDNTSCATTFVNSTTLTFTSPAKSKASYHLYVYNTDGTFAMKPNGITFITYITPSVEYLVIAGGGGGSSGGGGAGGLLTGTASVLESTTYTITVGSGGALGVGNSTFGTNGTNSSAVSVTAVGGGGGGTFSNSGANNGLVGGSGGGGGGSDAGGPGGTGAAGTAGQGNAGGNGFNQNTTQGRGGGGGAGAVGGNGSGSTGGAGGAGASSSITGSAVTYAGGGGGGSGVGSGGAGGAGGGGSGGAPSTAGSAATANTGGGGGGGGAVIATSGAAGGSGVVIIRYSDTYYAAVSTTGSPTVTVAGGYRVYKWTTSGSITF